MGTGYRWVQYKTSQQKKLNPLENIYFQDTPQACTIGICSLRYYIQIRGEGTKVMYSFKKVEDPKSLIVCCKSTLQQERCAVS
jgi:hypothetical protein